MKKIICLLVFLLCQLHTMAQNDFEINCIVLKYPKRFSNPHNLANKIKEDFTTDNAKARAIYSWMAFNIKYDVKKSLNPPKRKIIRYKTETEKQEKQNKLFEKEVNKTIRSGQGICGDYSALYYKLATLTGLKCEMNRGTAKTQKYDVGKKRAITDHGWNSVQVDGDWKLLDVTWGAGYVDEVTGKFEPNYNLFYFDTPKDLFFAKHYPEKGIWHDVVVDKNKFLDAPLLYTNLLNSEFRIIEPETGVVEICKNDSVIFKIKNITAKSKIRYSLRKEDEFGTVDTILMKDDLGRFEIKMDKKIGKFLTLYIDGIGVASYKIIQK